MPRALSIAAVVLLSTLILSCSDGDERRRSPTEPAPVTTAPVSLPGTWNGTMTVNRSGGGSTTCTLRLTVEDEGDPLLFTGDWTLQCPDGSRGTGFVALFAMPAPFYQVTISALQSGIQPTTVLDGCHWASVVPRQGRKLSGDWEKPNGACQGSTIQGGTLDLTKAE
jgi:hypothetical protein